MSCVMSRKWLNGLRQDRPLGGLEHGRFKTLVLAHVGAIQRLPPFIALYGPAGPFYCGAVMRVRRIVRLRGLCIVEIQRWRYEGEWLHWPIFVTPFAQP